MSADLLWLRGRPVIIGAGIAGLMTALELAPRPVILLSKASLGAEGSTLWAQGGMAAAVGDDDSPALHAADTVAAGDGLTDLKVAEQFARAAPEAIARLVRLGVRFDRLGEEGYALGLEAAHSRARIVHADGDGTGRELMRALIARAGVTPSIEILEGFEARGLAVEDNSVRGLLAVGPAGPVTFATDKVVIATGGIGGLFDDSTNPLGNFGQGLAMAAHAGAILADMEFVQFHPTALDVAARPMPLVSEAVRGEGALLTDETGERFLSQTPGAELAPRDVVARAIWRRRATGKRIFLDARGSIGDRFSRRFPAIAAACRAGGVDPARELIPVRPAQHYHMGGIAVDRQGRSSVVGLWACGEAACTGLHGSNRLASNSLTEAAVLAAAIARSVGDATTSAVSPPRRFGRTSPAPVPAAVRPILSRAAGVLRDGQTLRAGVGPLVALARSESPAAEPASVALMIVVAALRREHSVGAHCRVDFPSQPDALIHSRLALDEAFAHAEAIAPYSLARQA
jgi:L-aspartate oxidase